MYHKFLDILSQYAHHKLSAEHLHIRMIALFSTKHEDLLKGFENFKYPKFLKGSHAVLPTPRISRRDSALNDDDDEAEAGLSDRSDTPSPPSRAVASQRRAHRPNSAKARSKASSHVSPGVAKRLVLPARVKKPVPAPQKRRAYLNVDMELSEDEASMSDTHSDTDVPDEGMEIDEDDESEVGALDDDDDMNEGEGEAKAEDRVATDDTEALVRVLRAEALGLRSRKR